MLNQKNNKITSYLIWTSVSILLGLALGHFFWVILNTYFIIPKISADSKITTAEIILNEQKITNLEIVKIPEIKKTTLKFVGDIMLDRGVKKSVIKNFNSDYGQLFKNLNLLKEKDILFGNLEGPVSDTGKNLGNLYSFRMSPKVLPTLKEAGFDILSVANNHAGDWGRVAFQDSLNKIKENDLKALGGGKENEITKPIIFEKNDLKIGYLAFSDVGPNWLKSTLEKDGILLASDPNFEKIIKEASIQTDILIVSFHFGEEYLSQKHNKRQEYLAHKAIDSGAKIIIGHHPHVIEDIEFYQNGLIAYSLGNLIFDQYFSTNTMEGLSLEIELTGKEISRVNKKLIKLNKKFQPETIIDQGDLSMPTF